MAMAAIQLGWLLGAIPLLEPDEGRYLDLPRQMVKSGDWVTPRLNGVLYFEKPPLHYWLTAVAIRVVGLNETAARIWNVVLGFSGVLVVWGLARRQGGAPAGLAAAAVLGSMPLWIGLARLASLDMAVSLFITLSLGCVWLASRAAGGRRGRLFWWGAFASAACAVLTKGLIGAVIPAAVAGLWILATRRWSLLRDVPWLSGGAIFLALAAPWHVLASLRNPDFAWFYFVHEHLLRYATPVADRQEPWWFFGGVIVLGCSPWSGLLPAALGMAPGARTWRTLREHSDTLFFAIWFIFILVFFSASQSKLIPYVGPALPPLAVLMGLAVARGIAHPGTTSSLARWGLAVGLLLVGSLGAILAAAGLGHVDQLGLSGTSTPWLVAAGAVIVALAIFAMMAVARSRTRAALVGATLVACVLNLSLASLAPRLAEERSSRGTAEALRPHLADGDMVYSYRDYQESLPVYLEQPVGVVGAVGELGFGASHLSPSERMRRFPSAEEFRSTWDSPARIWLAVGRNWRKKLAADRLEHYVVIWEGRTRALLSNHPLRSAVSKTRPADSVSAPPPDGVRP